MANADHKIHTLPPIVITHKAAIHPFALYPLIWNVSPRHDNAVVAAYVSY